MGIQIKLDDCTGCGDCVPICPLSLLELVEDKIQLKEGCTLCGACQEICDHKAIVISYTPQPSVVSNGYQGVWVFAEQRNGKLRSTSYELLAKGRELANALDTELSAICLGSAVEGMEQLVAYGADKVYLMDDPALDRNQEDLYTGGLVRLIEQHKPEIVIAAATALGRSLIPRVAARLKTGLTADCTGLEIDPKTKLLLQTRPTFSGNMMATITCQTKRPQMSTVRPRVFKKNAIDRNRKGQLINVDFHKESITSKTNLLNFINELTERVKLEDADIIIAGGRGLGKAENFNLISDLANIMGAAIGSSRPPVDDGWIPYPHQVGQTGKTICPKLYIACGISGAVQHLAGMQTADTIIAINDDPNAPIFEVATYGIIGDLFQIIPRLIDRLKS